MNLDLLYRDAELAVSLQMNKTTFSGTVQEEALQGELVVADGMEVVFQSGDKTHRACVAKTETGYLVWIQGHVIRLDLAADEDSDAGGMGGGDGTISPMMPGTVVKILVEVGQKVAEGESVVIVESMKMQNAMDAPFDAVVESVNAKEGDLVQPGDAIIVLVPVDEEN